jgi:hypothetical protein
VSGAVTDVSEALPVCILKVQKFKTGKKFTFSTLNVEPASSSETQVFIPVDTESHTRTLDHLQAIFLHFYFRMFYPAAHK